MGSALLQSLGALVLQLCWSDVSVGEYSDIKVLIVKPCILEGTVEVRLKAILP
jgi:hypothetical protein